MFESVKEVLFEISEIFKIEVLFQIRNLKREKDNNQKTNGLFNSHYKYTELGRHNIIFLKHENVISYRFKEAFKYDFQQLITFKSYFDIYIFKSNIVKSFS